MARPLNADAAATRGRILGEASRLFAARGPTAVSIRDIARDAQVSLAMVHHYFGSKDELYAATVDAMYDELAGISDAIAGVLGDTQDLPRTLRLAAVHGFRFGRAHAEALRTVMREVVETGEIPAGRPRAMLEPFLGAVQALIGPLAPAVPVPELRLRAQSVCFVVARYALASMEDLALIAGLRGPAAQPERVLAHVESHLAVLAVSLIAPVEDSSCPAPSPPIPQPTLPAPSASRRAPSRARRPRATTASRP